MGNPENPSHPSSSERQSSGEVAEKHLVEIRRILDGEKPNTKNNQDSYSDINNWSIEKLREEIKRLRQAIVDARRTGGLDDARELEAFLSELEGVLERKKRKNY